MPSVVQPDTVLQPTPWCVIREQEDRYLIYNSRTDELHLITHLGMYIFQLCDGLQTAGEIQLLLGREEKNGAAADDQVTRYLAALVQRGVLEVAEA